ncbi:cytidylyl-2-hydroxypropylphosphonate hydrolase [Allostreptomyces psammosilenae]|uniref:DUF402 domain-containing protein n=1 Tax=Allostreptomyces psammosilenae TaxID=1892865 RepID=A0A853A0Z0_9ACTN|nr:DUF402 domain-containing protein [Allostreptomyces psammosilenae]NYI08039.1 hypothetical protein [Allostreptomyces psammosilenae]
MTTVDTPHPTTGGEDDGAGRQYWRPGQQILWRYYGDGSERVLDCRPMTVVEDTPEQLVAWLAPDTPLMRPLTEDGRSVRELPLADRFRVPRRATPSTWHGTGVLKVLRPGEPWSVWLFWEPGWVFSGWYVNLETRHHRWSLGVDQEDQVLDLWVRADGGWEWKDEDELESAHAAGRFDEADVARIRRSGERALELVRRWGAPFDQGWREWRPDPSWPVPALPADWDRPGR